MNKVISRGFEKLGHTVENLESQVHKKGCVHLFNKDLRRPQALISDRP